MEPHRAELIVEIALEQTELSPCEFAARFADQKRYFVFEAPVYRPLLSCDLIISPAFVVVKAADEFHHKIVRPNQMWQTDCTCFKSMRVPS